MSTPTQVKPLDIKQSEWLKKMGAALDVKVNAATIPMAATPMAGPNPAPSTPNTGQAAPGKSFADQAGTGSGSNDITTRILAKLKLEEGDLRPEFATLSKMDMPTLLDIMTKLKQAGKLEDLADRVTTEYYRIGVAILTIKPDFSHHWKEVLPKLNAEDRKAVLERTPADVKKSLGVAAPKSPDGKKEEEEGGPVVTIDQGGVQVQAKLEFESKLAGKLGSTEFSVKLSPDGKLSGVEVDLTLIKKKLEKMGVLTSMLDLTASLSLNAEAELDQKDTRVIFEGVQAVVKSEVQAKFKEIKALKRVTFKLAATVGKSGVSVTGVIEITIPGT